MNAQDISAFAPAGKRTADAPHRIVIVGGGAGGLELAVRLGSERGLRKRAEVVLVDAQPTHLWKPLLHEMAAGTLAADEGGVDFLQLARRHRFRFHLGNMSALLREGKEIVLAPLLDEEGEAIAPERRLWFDTLVIAVGSRDNDFGIPGVRRHALSLNAPDEAEHFHRRLLARLAGAEMSERGPVRVVIVGGGATGVELAAELAGATREIASYGAHLKDYGQPVSISIVENAPRLLAALPDYVGATAARDLHREGVDLHLGCRVTEVRADGVAISGGQGEKVLASDLTAWAAGIRCPDWLAGLGGLESNRLNQLLVTPSLQTTRDPDIFALGDCASCPPAAGAAPVPPKAQAAHQQARLLARSLSRRLDGKPPLDFVFHDRGSLVSLGQSDAVASVAEGRLGKTLKIEGLLARLSYWFLYRRHLATLLGLRQATLAVVGSWLAGRTHPRVKLH